jgi:hypothetical protein
MMGLNGQASTRSHERCQPGHLCSIDEAWTLTS